MSRWLAAMATATALLLVGGCATSGATAGSASAMESAGDGDQTLTVFAAASLRGTFTELGQRFETDHPGTEVTFGFGGSADLVTQLQQGAPADVFASADTTNMDRAARDDLVAGAPVIFATNALEIAVPPDNPTQVTSFADLAKPEVRLVVCAPQVPCGSATERVAQATGVELHPVSEENSVTDVLNKVTSGEADAGVVYTTDVQAAGPRITGIAFPESDSAVNAYPIAVLSDSDSAALAQQFVELVTGEEGRQVLRVAGFGEP